VGVCVCVCVGTSRVPTACDASEHRRLVVVGTGAARDKDDPHQWNGLSSIMLFSLRSDGALQCQFELPDVGVNPMFMCSADSGRLLYAVNMGTKQNAATLQTYAVDHTSWTLSKLGETPTADGPCHISTAAKDGRDVFGAPRTTQMVFVANYGAGNVGVHLARPDGTLAPAVCTIAHGAGASTIAFFCPRAFSPPYLIRHMSEFVVWHVSNAVISRVTDSTRCWTPRPSASAR
jgi:hypothetical protein